MGSVIDSFIFLYITSTQLTKNGLFTDAPILAEA